MLFGRLYFSPGPISRVTSLIVFLPWTIIYVPMSTVFLSQTDHLCYFVDNVFLSWTDVELL